MFKTKRVCFLCVLHLFREEERERKRVEFSEYFQEISELFSSINCFSHCMQAKKFNTRFFFLIIIITFFKRERDGERET